MTTDQLREYLDAHGVDGAPTELGWFAVRFMHGEAGIVFCDGRGFCYGTGARAVSRAEFVDGKIAEVLGERAGRCGSFFASDLVCHATLIIAPPAHSDLGAKIASGVRPARDDLRGIAGKAST